MHEEPPFYVHKLGFSFAFTAQNPVEEMYGKYVFNYVNVTYVNQTNEGRIKTVTSFLYENCTKELFGFSDDKEFYTTGL